MFFVLVKFKDQPTPVVMGTTHVWHASVLATMDNIEWVSPNIADGQALIEPRPNGGDLRPGVVGKYVRGYYPMPIGPGNAEPVKDTGPNPVTTNGLAGEDPTL